MITTGDSLRLAKRLVGAGHFVAAQFIVRTLVSRYGSAFIAKMMAAVGFVLAWTKVLILDQVRP